MKSYSHEKRASLLRRVDETRKTLVYRKKKHGLLGSMQYFALSFYTHFSQDSLYRNSFYLMASTAILSVFGFFFWILNARLYSPEQVGVATTLVSIMALLGDFSLLGLNIGLIRYLPKAKNRNKKINSALVLVSAASIISSLLFIAGLQWFSPQLAFIQKNMLYIITFTLFIIAASVSSLVESVFMAYRASVNILFKNTLLSLLKLVLPLFFVFLGAYGIVSSAAIATLVSVMFSVILLIVKYHFHPSATFSKHAVKEMASYSGGNYLAAFFSQAPSLILPIFIINMLSAKIAAYYYVNSMILSLLITIPIATTQSLLAEGSHDEKNLQEHLKKAIRITYILLIPSVIAIILFGNIVLRFFGDGYESQSFAFLRIICVSSLFMSISSLGNSVFRVRHEISKLMVMNILSAIIVLSTSYFFVPYGLLSIGWGWLLGQVLVSLLYVVVLSNTKLIKVARRFDLPTLLPQSK